MPDSSKRGWFGYLLVAAAIVCAWEAAKVPLLSRVPERLVQLATGSPEALSLIAEKELAAGRFEDARALAVESLAKAPFNVRALRVVGLADAEKDERGPADDLLTLAGNWSLRDDPAHAWLVQNRLRRGDYSSAFAHADTLARRRDDLYPQIFRLFTQAAITDPRSVSSLAALLTKRPPWRSAYLDSLRADPLGDQVLLVLAVGLAGKPGAFDRRELENLYDHWLSEGRIEAIKAVRSRAGPPGANGVLDSGFDLEEGQRTLPFGWRLGQAPGLSAQVLDDEVTRENNALRIQMEGMGAAVALHQLLVLDAGSYRLSARHRVEFGDGGDRVRWRLACTPGGQVMEPIRTPEWRSGKGPWGDVSATFVVPANGCPAQFLALDLRDADRRSSFAFWLDDVRLERVVPAAGRDTRAAATALDRTSGGG